MTMSFESATTGGRSSPVTSNGSGVGVGCDKQVDVDADIVLTQFRRAVDDLLIDELVDPDDLHRWLTARNDDVQKAEKMLRDSLAWRKQIGADHLATDCYDAPEVLKKYFPVGLVGHDKLGRPVWIIPYGQCDLKGLMQSAKKSDYVKYCIHLMEKSIGDMKIQQQLAPDYPAVQRHVVIVDLDNYGLKQATWKAGVDLMVHVSNVLSDNYPEVLESVYVINTPKVFEVAFVVLKKFINETTIRKIQVFGREHWQDALLEEVDATELPVKWGGTKSDDSCPSTLIGCGGDVPQSYYMAPANRLCEASNVQHAVVNKGCKLLIERDVTAPNTILKWEFKTEGNDIGFAVHLRPHEIIDEAISMIELLPYQRVNCHLVPEDGRLICSQPGKYILCFDNSFSRLRSKKLSYVVELLDAQVSL